MSCIGNNARILCVVGLLLLVATPSSSRCHAFVSPDHAILPSRAIHHQYLSHHSRQQQQHQTAKLNAHSDQPQQAPPQKSTQIKNATTPQTRKRRNKKASSTIQWIACSSTKEVTRAITTYVHEGDTVAELGSQLRDSSTALCERIGPRGRAVFVDVERKFPNEKRKKEKIKTIGQVDSAANNVTDNIADTDRTSAMRRRGDELIFFNDRATFVETKEFDYWRHALFFRPDRQQCHPHYNALVVDVSTVAGNDLELTCISLVKEFIALNQGYDDDEGEGEEELDDYDDDDKDKNRKVVVIVKSASLHNLARRLYHAQKVISGAQPLLPQEQVGGTSIIGTVGVDQYRETIPFVVKEGDVCVEIGCHFGTTTTLIDEAARGANSGGGGGCLGVDVGPNIISSAKKKYPHLSFQVGDGFKTGQIGRMRDEHFISSGTANSSLNRNTIPTYDVVYVDIGGLSGSEGLLEAVSLLSSISNSWEPRCIVIKSLCIRRLASCLVPFSDVWRKEKLKERELLNEDNR